MTFSERIRLLIDVVTGSSSSSLGKLKTDLAATDGAFGKMKVTASAAGNFLKQNVALGAAAAGTAIVGFAIKAGGAFQETALGAGRLSDQIGVTTETASRLQEVAGDLGISVDSVGGAINRMNRSAETSPAAFDEIGAAIARNADGTVDVIETFKNAAEAINRIPDATKRADAAQKIFGRGWQSIAELIMQGASGIETALRSVESAKIMDEGDIARARRFRDTLDEIAGKWESFVITAGSGLVTVVETLDDAAAGIDRIADGLDRVGSWVTIDAPDLEGTFVGVADGANDAADALDAANEAGVAANRTFYEMGPNFLNAADTAARVAANAGEMGPRLSTAAEMADYLAAAVERWRFRMEAAGETILPLGSNMGQLGVSFGDVADAASLAREAFDKVAGSAEFANAEFEAAVSALSGYRPAAEGLADIAQRSAEAFDGLKASVAEVGFTFDVATEAGRKNRDLLDDVAASMAPGFIAAYDNADGSMRKFKKSAAALGKETLAKLAEDMDLSAEQTAELATALGLTEGDYEARFKLAGAEEARLKLQLLQGAIEGLPPETQIEVQNLIINGDYEGALRVIKQHARDNPATTDLLVNVKPAQTGVDNFTGQTRSGPTVVPVLSGLAAINAALDNIPDETVYLDMVRRFSTVPGVTFPTPGGGSPPPDAGGGPRSIRQSGATYVTINNNRKDLTPADGAAMIRMARAS